MNYIEIYKNVKFRNHSSIVFSKYSTIESCVFFISSNLSNMYSFAAVSFLFSFSANNKECWLCFITNFYFIKSQNKTAKFLSAVSLRILYLFCESMMWSIRGFRSFESRPAAPNFPFSSSCFSFLIFFFLNYYWKNIILH